MKTIKKINVTVSYTVEIGGLNATEEVFDQLQEAYDNAEEIQGGSTEFGHANDWLADKIKEGDALDWSCEINHME